MRSGYLLVFECLQTKIKGYFCCSSSLHHLNPAYVKEEVCKSLLLPHGGIFGGGGENRTISLGTETRAQPMLTAHSQRLPPEGGQPTLCISSVHEGLGKEEEKKKRTTNM